MATRYPWLRYYEFFNEPDNADLLGAEKGGPYWGPYPERYAAMLRAVYPTLKAANPAAQVVFGGIAYDLFTDSPEGGSFDRHFLDNVLSSDAGGAPFDVFNFHYYPAFAAHWEEKSPGDRELVAKARYLRNRLNALGRPGVPMICTEVGMPSALTPLEASDPTRDGERSETIQARYVTKTAARTLAAGLDAVIWFAWKEFPAGSEYASFGLITRDLRPKAGVNAFRTATDKLGDAAFIEALAQDGIEGYALTGAGGHRLYVLWSLDSQTRTVRFAATRVAVTRYEGTFLGERGDSDDDVADGFVTLQVGLDPIYVEVM